MGRKRLREVRLNNNATDSSEKSGSFPSDGADSKRGSIESRHRKKGISLAYLLKSKKEVEPDTNSQPKPSNVSFISGEPKNNGGREQGYSELVNKFNTVRHKTLEDGKLLPKSEDAPAMKTFVERIMQKQSKMPPLHTKRKRSLWYKLARLVHLRQWSTSTELVPEQKEPKINHRNVVPKIDATSYVPPKRSLSPVDNRRTSWHPSKPSVSNWNRSELFTNSKNKQLIKKRRKTIGEQGMLLKTNLFQEKSQKKLPGILMTGSGLNDRNDSSDISPMSSNYSLTPSTSEEDNNDDSEESRTAETALLTDDFGNISSDKVPVLPSNSSNMKQFVAKIMCDFKATMDSYIAETEKDMCLRIIQLEEEIKFKDATIKDLQQQIAQQRRDSGGIAEEESEIEEEEIEQPPPRPPPQTRVSQDSAICSIDITSPSHQETGPVHFEEGEVWLVEFPQNDPMSLSVNCPQIRRHSSVEVGHEIPFRLTTQKSDDVFLRPAHPRDGSTSPRRFSESQARPDVVLNNSFAARVRRVFAKVKANRGLDESMDEAASPPVSFKWPVLTSAKTRRSSTGSSSTEKPTRQQLSRHEEFLGVVDPIKTLLPTITESCSFDSLRESPLMELKLHMEPEVVVGSEEDKDSVVIDVTDEHSKTIT